MVEEEELNYAIESKDEKLLRRNIAHFVHAKRTNAVRLSSLTGVGPDDILSLSTPIESLILLAETILKIKGD